MKKISLISILILLLAGCKKQSILSTRFDCNQKKYSNLKQTKDFNKNFTIDIPNYWQTKLYYTNFQSQLFTADTTKQLSETYILDTSFNLGEINFNPTFFNKTDSIIKSNHLILITSKKENFKHKESFWYVVKGFKNKLTFHQLNLIVKLSNNTYFSSTVDVYGDKNINERICGSLTILNSIEFLE